MIVFAYPFAFLLLLLPFFIRIILGPIKGLHGDGIRVPQSFFVDMKNISEKIGFSSSLKHYISIKIFFLFLIYSLVVCAIARPQIASEPYLIRKEAREILMIMDISTSMLERDFLKNNMNITRLDAVKDVVSKFVAKRTVDKIGIIFFASNAYLQSPMTYDHKAIIQTLDNVEAGMAGNSTAIGDALGLALKHLRDSQDKDKKVIILLTDGENNDGQTSMKDAISLADSEGIKIYTIFVGSADIIANFFGMSVNMGKNGSVDEKSLIELAQKTAGKSFRAEDIQSLEKIYQEIDKLEPTVNQDNFVQEIKDLYHIPLAFALVIASLLILWSNREKLG